MFYYYFKYSAHSFTVLNPGAKALASAFLVFAVYFLLVMFISAIVTFLVKRQISNPLDAGKFEVAGERSIIWGIISLIFGFVPGIMLIAGAIRLREAYAHLQQPVHEQAPPRTPVPENETLRAETVQQNAGRVQPSASQSRAQQYSVPSVAKHSPEMVKCKKCGSSFPSFMHACPNCNEPKA